MFFREWEVLIVDDEPDIIQVSRLAMRRFEVYGMPLRLRSAKSKEEALQVFANSPAPQPAIAVAFIDVVMETDSAGLDLCQALREQYGNRATQLFIRTGQPGVAPEREVLDRYDINGYFTKVEASEDKLYSLVKSGVRQYLWNVASIGTSLILSNAIAAGESETGIFEAARETFRNYHFVGEAPAGSRSVQAGIFVGDQLLGMNGMEPGEAQTLLDRLNSRAGKRLNADGDSYVQDGHTLMIKVPAGRPGGLAFVANTAFVPPESIVILYHRVLRDLALLLQRAK